MSLPAIHITGVSGLPEIKPGDDLGTLIAKAVEESRLRIARGDILVVTQKIVSKAEGRILRLDSIEPSPRARKWAAQHHKDARVVEVVLREARAIIRMERGVLIAETQHGYICANAGVDASNTAPGTVTLLPENPDQSARRLQTHLEKNFSVPLGVIISDTFGRPWREGVANVALGVAGLAPLLDYRGQLDTHGRRLQVTVVAVADELAGAAELVMRKTEAVPVAVIRGFHSKAAEGSGRELLRPQERDLFR